MKICFFTENYHKGGLDTFLINLFNSWPDVSDELTLVCNNTHPGLETIRAKTNQSITYKEYWRVFTSGISKGQNTNYIGRSKLVKLFFTLGYKVFQYPIIFPWYVLSLTWFFRHNDYDRLMVVNGGYPASLLCRCALIAWRFSGNKSLGLLNFHNSAIKPKWYSVLPEYIIDRLVIKFSSYIVTVSDNCLDSLKVRRAFQGCKKMQFIFNGIEDPALQLSHNKLMENQIDEAYCLMLATYEARKGHTYLLKAFQLVVKKIPDIRLRIYGYGSSHEKEVVVDEIKKLSLESHVSINDFSNNTTSLIANAKVLVVPSQEYESFGLTIIEAMALGTPVVATDVGGIPEVLSDSDAGYICLSHDPEEFAFAIIKILSDHALMENMGKNGRLTFENKFTSLEMSKKYLKMIKE